MGQIIPFPMNRHRDLIEVRKVGALWSVGIVQAQGPMRLARYHSRAAAERFAEGVARVRGNASVVIREVAP